ncbi:MAG: hypothetical protein ACK5M0_03565 [Bacteroidales bacterium]|jgi:hypothetical protein
MQEREQNFAIIKSRIMQIPDLLGITKSEFYKKIGVSSSNYNGKSRYSEITADILYKISTVYSEISIEWLVTGKGEMLRSNATNEIKVNEVPCKEDYKEKYINIIEENRELRIDIINKEKQIQELKETTEKLKEKIDLFQKEAIKSKELKNRSKVPPVKLPNSPECVQ